MQLLAKALKYNCLLLTLVCCGALAQSHKLMQPAPTSILQTDDDEKGDDDVTLVYLENCETLSFDKARLPDAQLLKGNVRFRHDDAVMFCDSAYFYEKENSLDAFGHVRFVQGDTIFGFGDVLYYNGNTKIARLRQHVRLENKQTTLTTDSLNYDRVRNLAYYFTGGTIRDSLNTLTSVWGQYEPPTDQAMFKNNVLLVNPNFTLEADTLKYNTQSNIADLVGPTKIVYQEETTIYSTLGWYNTANEKSMLLNRSKVAHEDGKTLIGDTIYYDKRQKQGQVRSAMEMADSVQQTTLYGNYGFYDEVNERGFATDSALLIEWSSKDSLFVHADSLFTEKDSSFQVVRAYYGVRIFRNDMQAVCDSMVYTDRDSVMNLYHEPIMWNEGNQISADFVRVFMKNDAVDYAQLTDNAIAIKQEDDTRFDQLSGKEIFAYIREGELYLVEVKGNAETVFFPREEEGIIGVNKTQSSVVKLYIKDQKIERVVFTTATNGTMYPLEKLTEEQTHLSAFFWAEQERPKNRYDVFLHPEHVKRPEKVGLSAASAVEETETQNSPKNSAEIQSATKRIGSGNRQLKSR